jgi:hypothetical protein
VKITREEALEVLRRTRQGAWFPDATLAAAVQVLFGEGAPDVCPCRVLEAPATPAEPPVTLHPSMCNHYHEVPNFCRCGDGCVCRKPGQQCAHQPTRAVTDRALTLHREGYTLSASFEVANRQREGGS